MNHKLSWLLGFRSNTLWKKIVSVAYMVLCVVVAYNLLIATKTLVDVITSLVFIAAMVSPYIVLSNTSLRERLPLFNAHKAGFSMIGFGGILLILSLILTALPTA